MGSSRLDLDRRQTFATDPAAVAESGAAALGGLAVKKSVLSFAANLRWLILSFHVCRPVPPGCRISLNFSN